MADVAMYRIVISPSGSFFVEQKAFGGWVGITTSGFQNEQDARDHIVHLTCPKVVAEFGRNGKQIEK